MKNSFLQMINTKKQSVRQNNIKMEINRKRVYSLIYAIIHMLLNRCFKKIEMIKNKGFCREVRSCVWQILCG